MKTFQGNVLFLDRSDINTDEIIPARYLTELTKPALKHHLLEDLALDGFSPADMKNVGAIVTRENFGCGSSREHAAWALEMNGIHVVAAQSFARIFRQNMYNGGMLAVELPAEQIGLLFSEFSGPDTWLDIDWSKRTMLLRAGSRQRQLPFSVSGFDAALIEAGGWVDYAAAKY